MSILKENIQIKFYKEICSNRLIMAAAENIDLEPIPKHTSAGGFEFERTSSSLNRTANTYAIGTHGITKFVKR